MDTKLNTYDKQLIQSIQRLKAKRAEIDRQAKAEEQLALQNEKELKCLTERQRGLNESLKSKIQARTEYDNSIMETEAAYSKILETAHILVDSVKKRFGKLDRKASSVLSSSTTIVDQITGSNYNSDAGDSPL